MINPNTLPAALLAVFAPTISRTLIIALVAAASIIACPSAQAQPVLSFGPGRAQIVGSGGQNILLDAPGKQAALRFIAEVDGPLKSIRFASRIGEGWTWDRDSQPGGIFKATLFEDAAGKPGRRLAEASHVYANSPGARAREVSFTGVNLRAGRAYHLVIYGAASGTTLSVDYYLFGGREGERLNSYDMQTLAEGASVLESTNNGSKWTELEDNAIGIMAIDIGGRIQGWAYTGPADNIRIWNTASGDKQTVMQSFRFSTNGRGSSATAIGLRIALRAQGGLGETTVRVRVRLSEMRSGRVIAEVIHSMDTGDTVRFYTQDIKLPSGVVLTDGAKYLLSVDLPDAVSKSASDYLFCRGLAWGYGGPGLEDATWQGADQSLILLPSSALPDGEPQPRIDLPFILDYRLGR